MHIKVKGCSSHLIFIFDDHQEFNCLIKELKSLLESPLFRNDGYFPRAFFDFKSRVLSIYELEVLLDLLFEKQVLIFDGINTIKQEQRNKVKVIKKTIHAGEVLKIAQDTLLIGQINPGARVCFRGELIVMGRVSGVVEGIGSESRISGQCFKDAQIIINGVTRRHYTSFEFTMLYYKDNEIFLDKGDIKYV